MAYDDGRNYDRIDGWVRWARRGVLIVIGLVLALCCVWVYTQVQAELQMRVLMGQVVNVLNYNLQGGTLKAPPPPQAPPQAQAQPPQPPQPPPAAKDPVAGPPPGPSPTPRK